MDRNTVVFVFTHCEKWKRLVFRLAKKKYFENVICLNNIKCTVGFRFDERIERCVSWETASQMQIAITFDWHQLEETSIWFSISRWHGSWCANQNFILTSVRCIGICCAKRRLPITQWAKSKPTVQAQQFWFVIITFARSMLVKLTPQAPIKHRMVCAKSIQQHSKPAKQMESSNGMWCEARFWFVRTMSPRPFSGFYDQKR